MSLKTFALDTGLPTLLLLGTGLMAYYLTGGGEEFPDNIETSQTDSAGDIDELVRNDARHIENEALEQLEKQGDLFNQSVLEIKAQYMQLETQTSKGFEEIKTAVTALTEDVQWIRATAFKSTCPNCHHQLVSCVAESTENAGKKSKVSVKQLSTVPSDRSLTEWRRLVHFTVAYFAFALDAAFDDLVLACDSTASEETISQLIQSELKSADVSEDTGLAKLHEGCDVLLMYANNLLRHSGVPRYRKISAINHNYKEVLAKLPGYSNVLRVLGFRKKEPSSTTYEWQWTPENIRKRSEALGCLPADLLPGSEEVATSVLTECVTLLKALRESKRTLCLKLQQEGLAVGVSNCPTLSAVGVEEHLSLPGGSSSVSSSSSVPEEQPTMSPPESQSVVNSVSVDQAGEMTVLLTSPNSSSSYSGSGSGCCSGSGVSTELQQLPILPLAHSDDRSDSAVLLADTSAARQDSSSSSSQKTSVPMKFDEIFSKVAASSSTTAGSNKAAVSQIPRRLK